MRKRYQTLKYFDLWYVVLWEAGPSKEKERIGGAVYTTPRRELARAKVRALHRIEDAKEVLRG